MTEFITPELIQDLLKMPVFLIVLYVLWNNNKTQNRQLDIIEKLSTEKGKM